MASLFKFKPAFAPVKPATQKIDAPCKTIARAFSRVTNALGFCDADNEHYNLVSYFGGKYNKLGKILPYIEMLGIKNNAHTYLECFGGSGKCILNLDTLNYHFDKAIYNEWDKGMCNLFEVVADEDLAEQLAEELNQIDYSEYNFKYCKAHKNDAANSLLESACMAYVVCQMSYNADFRNFRQTKYGCNYDVSFYNRTENILLAAEHLQGIEVINGDYKIQMEKYGTNPQVVKYLDPPYHPACREKNSLKVYTNELSRELHQEMVSLLCNSRSWILSGYDPAQYRCDDYAPLEANGAVKVSIGEFIVTSSNDKIYKEEFIWYKD